MVVVGLLDEVKLKEIVVADSLSLSVVLANDEDSVTRIEVVS